MGEIESVVFEVLLLFWMSWTYIWAGGLFYRLENEGDIKKYVGFEWNEKSIGILNEIDSFSLNLSNDG